jgi:SAM-dependent methyltransferase
MNGDLLVRVLGWHATVLHANPLTYLRWLWLQRRLWSGPWRTLDAGCGSGAFTMYAARIGNEAVGISFNPVEITKASRRAQLLGLSNVRFVEGDLRALNRMAASLGRFDQIICCETIEHILDDHRLVADLAALLRPGGQLLLTTRHRPLPPLPGDRITSVEDGNEVRWGYTHGDLLALFEACGLRVVRQELFGGAVSYALVAAERLLSRVNPRLGWLAVQPLRPLQILDAPLSRLLRFPPMTVAVVGVKDPFGGV